MLPRHVRRLIGTSIVVGGLAGGVLAVPARSGSVTSPAQSPSTLTVAFPPGAVPTSVLPFSTMTNCYAVDIDYWNLMYRPAYWFGLGNSVSVQYALSPFFAPAFKRSGSNTIVTMVSKGWKWTNGSGGTQTLDAQDINFWLNMDKAQEDQGNSASCGYWPASGIPDQLVGVSDSNGPAGDEVQLTFAGHASETWLLYNELSQIDPMPIAWDISDHGGAPGPGGCSRESYANVTVSGSDRCSTVFRYLQRLRMSNALWKWSDGPYRQQSATARSVRGVLTGADVQVANAHYSGPVKPHAVQAIDYTPFVSENQEQSALRAGTIDLGYLAPSEVSRSPGPGRSGAISPKLHLSNYTSEGSTTWGVFYWVINFDDASSNYETQGALPIWADELNNRYFRDAMQEAIDQPELIKDTLNGYGVDSYSAVPAFPENWFAQGVSNPWKYDPSKARAMMEANGWSGSTPATCTRANCGSSQYPIPMGSEAIVELTYPPEAGVQVSDEVKSIGRTGIEINAQPSGDVVGGTCPKAAIPWQICDYGGWIYSPDYDPSGEELFTPGSSNNPGGYDSPEMNALIAATTTLGSLGLTQVDRTYHTSYAEFTATDLPVLWQPTPTTGADGDIGVVSKSIEGAQPSNPFGDFNPEYITAI